MLGSFHTKKEFFDTSVDIARASAEVGLKVKYILTSEKVDPAVLKNNDRVNDETEKIIGLIWDIKHDTVQAQVNLNVFRKIRGKSSGPKLCHTDLESLKPTRRIPV